MPRFISIIGILLSLDSWLCAQAKFKNLENSLTTSMESWKAPGLAVIVIVDDKVILAKGYGKRNAVDPVDADTLFPLASCSKAFTSALMAGLVDDGKLTWDDPVRKHLPTFRLSDPDADKLLTMRDLFCHGSGLGGHDLLWYRAPWDLNEVVRRSQHVPLSGPFRASYNYSSLPYIVAGKALENRTEQTWQDLIRERLATPLGWKSLALTTAEVHKNTNRASGYQKFNGKIVPMDEVELREPNPAGSIHLSANDLGTWIRFQLADGQWNGKQLISAKNLKITRTPHTPMPMEGEMLTVYPETQQTSYAMGWVVYDYRGELVFGHGGIIDGYRAQITLLPKRKIGFALLNNLHHTKMNLAIGNTMIDILLGLPAKDWNAHYQKVEVDEAKAKDDERAKRNKERKPDLKPSFELKQYVREYENEAFGKATVTLDKGVFMVEWSSFNIPLEHWQGDEFRVTSGFFADEIIPFVVRENQLLGLQIREMPFQKK